MVTTVNRVTFLGGGNMARALIQGLLRQGVAPTQLSVGEPDAAQRSALQRDFGITALADNAAALSGARVAVLAVKPQQLRALFPPLHATLSRHRPLLLSIVAGVRCAQLAQSAAGLPVIRAMPNRAALVGAGITALFAGPGAGPEDRVLAEQVLSAAGSTVWVPSESDLDIVTALSGSGPAYFFQLAEHMATAAQALGLDAHTATLLARETLRGTGALCSTPLSLAEQRQAVTSKGGTTEAALQAFSHRDFAGLVTEALTAATDRAKQLAGQFAAELD